MLPIISPLNQSKRPYSNNDIQRVCSIEGQLGSTASARIVASNLEVDDNEFMNG